MRDDINFARSRTILIGTSRYTAGFNCLDMPAAVNSLAALRTALISKCGWPDSRVTELVNRASGDNVLRKVAPLIHETDDVLLLYYVGHGQLLPGNDLGLALTDTSEDPRERSSTSLCLRDLRREIDSNCDARVKIVVLDCCCSGIATKYTQGGNLSAQIHEAAKLEAGGTYTWTACGHSQETYFEPFNGGLTYFTKFLTETVNNGVDGHGEGLTLGDIHREVNRRFRQTEIPNAPIKPEPVLLYRGSTDEFVFVPNPRHLATGRAEPERNRSAAPLRELSATDIQAVVPPRAPRQALRKTPSASKRVFNSSWNENIRLEDFSRIRIPPAGIVAFATFFLIACAIALGTLLASGNNLCANSNGGGSCNPAEYWSGQRIAGLAFVPLFMVIGFGSYRFERYREQRRLAAWTLQIDADGIRVEGQWGRYEFPHGYIREVCIDEIKMPTTNSPIGAHRVFDGIYIRLKSNAHTPWDERPAGLPAGAKKPKQGWVKPKGSWIPICVLGPMAPSQRKKLDAVLAPYRQAVLTKKAAANRNRLRAPTGGRRRTRGR